MLNRIVCFALIFTMTCAVWAARPNAPSDRGRRGGSQSARRNASTLVVPRGTPRTPAAPVHAQVGKIVAVTAQTITFHRAKSGLYEDLVMDRDTTTVQMALADDVVVRALKRIALSDIQTPANVVVQPTDSRFSLPAATIDVKGLYVQPNGAPAPGGSVLAGILNTETTTPTLQMGTLLVNLRLSPKSGVFRQEVGKITDVKPGQFVRIGIRSVDNKPVVSVIGIGSDIGAKKASDAKNAPPPALSAKRLAPNQTPKAAAKP